LKTAERESGRREGVTERRGDGATESTRLVEVIGSNGKRGACGMVITPSPRLPLSPSFLAPLSQLLHRSSFDSHATVGRHGFDGGTA